jgi:thioester reductase-like protein
MKKNYFITGATGAIGAALVPILLKDKEISVNLLIRADNAAHLQDRLNKLFHFWEFESNDERKERIVGIIGDISRPLFGMEKGIYDQVSSQCTHIIHCAGNVRMNLSIEDARKCSVDSAKNVVALAKVCKKNNNLEKIEFVSTVGVGGDLSRLPETWISEKREFHNTYEQAKAEAEDYIRDLVETGLPLTVHRPSMVVGDSETGKIIHFQIFYHICEFLSGRRTLSVIPNTGNVRLDTIPCDYVAGVIAWSSRTRETTGQVLHECSGPEHAILLTDLKKMVQKCFREKRIKLPKPVTIPVWLFKAAVPVISLFVPPKAKRAMRALPVFFDYLAENQGFENGETWRQLENKIEFPFVGGYLEKVIGRYLQR